MRLAISFDLGSGEQTTTVSPFAIIGYEREHRTKISKLATEGIGLGDMAELAWRQLQLEGVYTGDLDSFERQLVDVNVAVTDPT